MPQARGHQHAQVNRVLVCTYICELGNKASRKQPEEFRLNGGPTTFGPVNIYEEETREGGMLTERCPLFI